MKKAKKIKPTVQRVESVCIHCPDPFILESETSTGYFDSTEFSSSQLVNAQSDFNHTKTNKPFVHTFVWKPKHKCCQVTRATVQIRVKALQNGTSRTDGMAGTDTIGFVKNGGIPIFPGDHLYPNLPVSKGDELTRSWTLIGNQLAWLNHAHKLSLRLQDDSEVLWIKVRLEICCLDGRRVASGELEEQKA